MEGAGLRPALGGGRGHRLYYLKSLAVDRRTEPWSALLDAGREDGRLVREAREGPGAARTARRAARRSCTPTCSRRSRGSAIEHLYSHQAQALHAAWAGPTIVTTGHRVGQVAVLQPADARRALPRRARARAVPVSDEGARPGPGARARGLRPDQARAPGDLRRRHAARGARARSAASANVVLTNPDMLHVGILPNHAAWAELFANLAVVVIDEAHVYRGVFGSHVANVLRRLRRIAAAYGTEPRFLLTSATIANPVELAERLTGLEDVQPDRRGRLAGAAAADRRLEPAADRRGARHAPLGARRGRRAARAARARRRAHDLLHEVAQGRRGAEPPRQGRPRRSTRPRARRARRALPRRLHRRSSAASSRAAWCAASCAR